MTLSTITNWIAEWSTRFVDYLPELAGAAAVMVVAVLIARMVARLLTRGVDHIDYDGPAMTLIVAAAKVVVVSVGAFIAMGILGLDKTVTSLLAGVGVIGLALGFAFQDIAANLMSGTLMAFKPPFRVGDLVETNGYMGTIEEVSLRFTALRTFEGQVVMLPNKDVLSNPVVNFVTTGERRIDVAVGVGYDTDLDMALETAKKAVADLDVADDDQRIDAFCTSFGGSSIDLTVRFWLSLSNEQVNFMSARSRAIVAIKRAFDEKGIDIPFPIRTLDMGADVVEMFKPSSGQRERATGT